MAKKNVGRGDSYIRISAGLLMLTYAITHSKEPDSWLPHALAIAGAMKVAEGITRWSPLYDVLGLTTVGDYLHDM